MRDPSLDGWCLEMMRIEGKEIDGRRLLIASFLLKVINILNKQMQETNV
jgi:hypothetical protein